MKHIEAGVTLMVVAFVVVFAVTGLAHFVGGSMAGIIITAVVVIGIAGAVIDYLTEER